MDKKPIEEFKMMDKLTGKEMRVWAFSEAQALRLALKGKTKPEGIELVGKPFKV